MSDHECEECGATFDTAQGRKQHHSKVHGVAQLATQRTAEQLSREYQEASD